MVRRPADPCRIDPFKAYIAQIQCLNKHIDRANRIVFVDPILKAFWQQRRLPAIQPRHEARHQIPRRFSKGIIAWQEVSHSLDATGKSASYKDTCLRRRMNNKLLAGGALHSGNTFWKR